MGVRRLLTSALLEDQARISERQKPVSLKPKLEEGQRVIKTKDIKFDPVLAHPGSLPRFIPQRVEESGTLAKTAQLVQSDDLPESLQSLVDLVGEHFKDKLTMPNAEEDDVRGGNGQY